MISRVQGVLLSRQEHCQGIEVPPKNSGCRTALCVVNFRNHADMLRGDALLVRPDGVNP